MNLKNLSIGLLLAAILTGCATIEPISFEESLQTKQATRNDFRDWDEELRYRVELQYANAARQRLENPTIDVPANTSREFMVPFAIWEVSRGNDLSGALGFADWFNSGLSKESRYSFYFNRTLAYVANPNSLYFTFDERDGVANTSDVHSAWDEAYELMNSVHNIDGQCQVFGFSEEYQYAKTYPKDVPGKYKEILYLCTNPVFEGKQQKVMVSAYANPFDGVRVLAAVVPQCWPYPEDHSGFVDQRDCGERLAEKQRALLPDSRFGWTELVTTPKKEEPYQFEVRVQRGSEVAYLPAPEITEKYQNFLRERPY